MKAVGYSRVSTGSEAETRLSITDQMRSIEAYCGTQGLEFERHYVDSGLSGTDDNRPEFQLMIADAMTKPRMFDVIVCHSASRFFRDAAVMELYVRQLRRAGVTLLFTTQTFTDDPTGDLMRQIVGAFDQHQSRETSKHVTRTMLANARENFWNGAAAPFGFETYVAEAHGKKLKKKLRPDPVESSVVRLIFDMAEHGLGAGPMGMKAIVNELHRRGYRTRRGCAWHLQTVYSVLTSEAAKGVFWYNTRDSKTGELRPVSEHVRIEYPGIIEADRWDRVRAILKAKNPKVGSPKTQAGPILLTGLAHCQACGSAMTLRTGKSGKYRYYTCSGAQARGPAVCEGLSLPMDTLDGAVSEALAERLFEPQRLSELLHAVLTAEQSKEANQRAELLRIETELATARAKLDRLLSMVSAGAIEATDPDLKAHMDAVRQDRDIALAAKERVEKRLQLASSFSPEKVVAFGQFLRAVFQTGGVPFRKQYARMFIERIDVSAGSAAVRVRKAALRRNVEATEGGVVPISIQEWRTRQDSNL